jgi:hypothetical protein
MEGKRGSKEGGKEGGTEGGKEGGVGIAFPCCLTRKFGETCVLIVISPSLFPVSLPPSPPPSLPSVRPPSCLPPALPQYLELENERLRVFLRQRKESGKAGGRG